MPRYEERAEILESLANAWVRYPDLRLGQLIYHSRSFNEDGSINEGPLPTTAAVHDKLVLAGLRGMSKNFDDRTR